MSRTTFNATLDRKQTEPRGLTKSEAEQELCVILGAPNPPAADPWLPTPSGIRRLKEILGMVKKMGLSEPGPAVAELRRRMSNSVIRGEYTFPESAIREPDELAIKESGIRELFDKLGIGNVWTTLTSLDGDSNIVRMPQQATRTLQLVGSSVGLARVSVLK